MFLQHKQIDGSNNNPQVEIEQGQKDLSDQSRSYKTVSSDDSSNMNNNINSSSVLYQSKQHSSSQQETLSPIKRLKLSNTIASPTTIISNNNKHNNTNNTQHNYSNNNNNIQYDQLIPAILQAVNQKQHQQSHQLPSSTNHINKNNNNKPHIIKSSPYDNKNQSYIRQFLHSQQHSIIDHQNSQYTKYDGRIGGQLKRNKDHYKDRNKLTQQQQKYQSSQSQPKQQQQKNISKIQVHQPIIQHHISKSQYLPYHHNNDLSLQFGNNLSSISQEHSQQTPSIQNYNKRLLQQSEQQTSNNRKQPQQSKQQYEKTLLTPPNLLTIPQNNSNRPYFINNNNRQRKQRKLSHSINNNDSILSSSRYYHHNNNQTNKYHLNTSMIMNNKNNLNRYLLNPSASSFLLSNNKNKGVNNISHNYQYSLLGNNKQNLYQQPSYKTIKQSPQPIIYKSDTYPRCHPLQRSLSYQPITPQYKQLQLTLANNLSSIVFKYNGGHAHILYNNKLKIKNNSLINVQVKILCTSPAHYDIRPLSNLILSPSQIMNFIIQLKLYMHDLDHVKMRHDLERYKGDMFKICYWPYQYDESQNVEYQQGEKILPVTIQDSEQQKIRNEDLIKQQANQQLKLAIDQRDIQMYKKMICKNTLRMQQMQFQIVGYNRRQYRQCWLQGYFNKNIFYLIIITGLLIGYCIG